MEIILHSTCGVCRDNLQTLCYYQVVYIVNDGGNGEKLHNEEFDNLYFTK